MTEILKSLVVLAATIARVFTTSRPVRAAIDELGDLDKQIEAEKQATLAAIEKANKTAKH